MQPAGRRGSDQDGGRPYLEVVGHAPGPPLPAAALRHGPLSHLSRGIQDVPPMNSPRHSPRSERPQEVYQAALEQLQESEVGRLTPSKARALSSSGRAPSPLRFKAPPSSLSPLHGPLPSSPRTSILTQAAAGSAVKQLAMHEGASGSSSSYTVGQGGGSSGEHALPPLLAAAAAQRLLAPATLAVAAQQGHAAGSGCNSPRSAHLEARMLQRGAASWVAAGCPGSPSTGRRPPGAPSVQPHTQVAAEAAVVAQASSGRSCGEEAPAAGAYGVSVRAPAGVWAADAGPHVDAAPGHDRALVCEAPDSPCSASAMALESPHQPGTSRFALQGRSNSMTFKPHPPAMSRKTSGGSATATKAPAMLASLGLGGMSCSAGSSPVAPHMLATAEAQAMWPCGGSNSPGPQLGGSSEAGMVPRFRRSFINIGDAASGGGAASASATGAAATASPGMRPQPVRGPATLFLGGLMAGADGSLPSSPSSAAGGNSSTHGAFSAWDELGTSGRASSLPAGGLLQADVGLLHSPGPAGGGAGVSSSRPSSGRNKAVQMLIEAVRSRDEGQLEETLAYLASPNGGIAGLNDRHPITGRTALHEAVMLNSLPAVRRLLGAGSNPCVGHPQTGPPLLHAAAVGQEDAVSALLAAGAEVEAVDIAGWTALHHACSSGHVATARLLIKHHASMSSRTHEGETPLDVARQEFLQALCEAGAASPTGAGIVATLSAGGAQQQQQHAVQPPQPGAASLPSSASSTSSAGGLISRRGSRGNIGMLLPAPAGCGGSREGTPPISPAARVVLGEAQHRPSPPERPRSGVGSVRPWRGSALEPLSAEFAATDGVEDSPRAPTPPVLQLPRHLRALLSKGAQLTDILSFFSEEDAALIRTAQQVEAAPGGQQQGAVDAAVTAAALAALSHAAAGGGRQLWPGLAPPAPSGSRSDSPLVSPLMMPMGVGAAFASTPHRASRLGSESGSASSPAGRLSQQSPAGAALPPPRFKFGIEPAADAAAGVAAPGTPAQPAVLASLPVLVAAPAQLPRQSASSGLGDEEEDCGSGGDTDAQVRSLQQQLAQQALIHLQEQQQHHAARLQQQQDEQPAPQQPPAAQQPAQQRPATAATPQEPEQDSDRHPDQSRSDQCRPDQSRPDQEVASVGQQPAPGTLLASLGSGSGSAPPLVRDDSPTGSVAGSPGRGGTPVGGAAPSSPKRHTGRAAGGGLGAAPLDPLKLSRAAEALKDMGVNASTEAINLRAAAMFSSSQECRTGDIQWTRGELIGEGAYGKVYCGLNQTSGELMAVKVLELIGVSGSRQSEAQLSELRQELAFYKELSHKHIVGFIDAQYEPRGNALYIFLEYVPGGSIASMLERFGRFSEELARNYTRQLLQGLDYLHGRRIVHRDLKGANILVTRDGIIKLADFGASKAYRDATATNAMKSLKGSVFWMAPEVVTGTGYGRRADIWSLGCTVIEMLTGAHPWPDADNNWSAMFAIARSTEGPPRPTGISAAAADFINACLKHNMAERPTAAELLQHPWVAAADAARRQADTAPRGTAAPALAAAAAAGGGAP